MKNKKLVHPLPITVRQQDLKLSPEAVASLHKKYLVEQAAKELKSRLRPPKS